jgi:hypothetical protein
MVEEEIDGLINDASARRPPGIGEDVNLPVASRDVASPNVERSEAEGTIRADSGGNMLSGSTVR